MAEAPPEPDNLFLELEEALARLTLPELERCIAVFRYGSVRAAARHCGCGRRTINRALAALRKELTDDTDD